ncbi:glycoside hydrolase family 16 protein [Robiginitalea sp. 2V75]|uniref:Glycoside hydrolase family 16 protein n=2 Tax=Robiginitalea marina TaxID=2954105 RepID=A0ABT1B1J4_9FLAO|nr:glycoside hydrolase family 16 protein [Robiginitalea marina]MCO5725849.1 glycoside hydrolase family 16 protein [Robiginitalea marina]
MGWGCSNDDTQTVVNFTELTMQDEFDTDGPPNPDIWNFDIGTGQNGWGNNELQYYTDRPENVTVNNGYLIITARQESFEGSNYTSARLVTKNKFEQRYGRFEARMRLPYGQGMWPAFWMLGADIDTNPWPGCGEIDIMENKGRTPSIVSSAVHGPGYSAGQAIFKEYDFVNDRVDTGFHVYGIEWGPGYINFYVDDVLYNQITPEDVTGEWVFDNGPFFLLLNLAVGGTFDGPPNAETVFPQSIVVDYVRVYKNNRVN